MMAIFNFFFKLLRFGLSNVNLAKKKPTNL